MLTTNVSLPSATISHTHQRAQRRQLFCTTFPQSLPNLIPVFHHPIPSPHDRGRFYELIPRLPAPVSKPLVRGGAPEHPKCNTYLSELLTNFTRQDFRRQAPLQWYLFHPLSQKHSKTEPAEHFSSSFPFINLN